MTGESRWPPVVLDLGVGLSAALVAKLMVELGAKVTRIEPSSGDPFYEVYPSYRLLRSVCNTAPIESLEELLATADVCIVGGEDHPDASGKFDAAELSTRHPQLIVLDLTADLSKTAKAVDLLIQARTGLCFEQFSQRPVCFATALPTYGAALLGTLGVWSALFERSRSGRGQVVTASMQQGTALFWSPFWMRAQQPDVAFDTITPKDVRHLIFECADGDYIQLVMGVPGALRKLYGVLGIDVAVAADDRGHPKPNTPTVKYFGDHELIAPRVRRWRRAELLAALRQAGLAAEAVLAPGECWNDEQVRHNSILRDDAAGWRYVGAPIELKPAGLASRIAGKAQTTAPLDGIRIVDLGNFVAGPFSSRLLASLGADVIKVDPPSGAATISGYRTVYASNCGKRSLCVDMKTPEGQQILAKLCETADVVHHNFRVSVAERLGVDAKRLRESNPSLIVLHATAYGSSGPRATHPGFDMVMQALCGHEMRAGGEGNPPLWYRSPFVDFATGTLGAIAIVAGLVHRQATGVTVDAEVSLLDTALFLMSELVEAPDGTRHGVASLDHERTGFHPAESLYQTRDGWIAIAARTDAMAQCLAQTLQLSLPSRSIWSASERAALAERIKQFDSDDLLKRLNSADVWAERCVADGWAALCADDVARSAQLVVDVPDERYGVVSGCLGPLTNFSRSSIATSTLRAAPTLGQHSEPLLNELGYSPENIQRLRDSRVIA